MGWRSLRPPLGTILFRKEATPLACLSILVLLLSATVALSKSEDVVFNSPDRNYSIRLLPTGEPTNSTLHILHRRHEIAAYAFQGTAENVFWSPSGRYVALNNHSGHRGWYLWIISLRTGKIIRSTGPVHERSYDRYRDEHYLPDLFDVAAEKIRLCYPSYKADMMRDPYISLAYRWAEKGALLVFHEFVFDDLYLKEHAVLHAYTVAEVNDQTGITFKSIEVKKVDGNWWNKYPEEIKAALGP